MLSVLFIGLIVETQALSDREHPLMLSILGYLAEAKADPAPKGSWR